MVRKHLAVKKSEFAEKLHITQERLESIETGKKSPGFHFFYYITQEWGVNPLYLLFGDKPFLLRKIPIDNSGIAQSNDSEHAVEQLFWYMQRSKIIKFNMLEYFIKFKLEHKHAIIDDMEQQQNENFSYIPVFRPSSEPTYMELQAEFIQIPQVTNLKSENNEDDDEDDEPDNE